MILRGVRFFRLLPSVLPILIAIGIGCLAWLFLPSTMSIRVTSVGLFGAILFVGGCIAFSIELIQFLQRKKEIQHLANINQLQAKQLADRLRFLNRLDHELKTPISSITVALTNINTLNANRESIPDIKTALNETQRLHQMVEGLRKLSNIETRALDIVPINLNEMIKLFVDNLEENTTDINHRDIRLILPLPPLPTPLVMGDHDLLLLALNNLILNAIKYTHEGGKIVIRVSDEGNLARIDIADTGIGIAEADIPYIWDDLYRGSNAKAVKSGNGLGLAIVKRVIQRHSGKVAVKSLIGKETIFTLWLPMITTS